MIDFLGKLLALSRRYRFRLGLGILFGILSGLSNLALVITLKLVIGVVFPAANASPWAEQMQRLPGFVRALFERLQSGLPPADAIRSPLIISAVVGLIPLVMILRGLAGYLNVYFLQWVAIRAITDLRIRLFNHLLNLSLQFFHRTGTGDLMSRIMNDTGAMQQTICYSLAVMITAPVTVVALAGSLLWDQPKLTLISVIILPAVVFPIVTYSRKVRKASEGIQTSCADLSRLMHEAFTGNRIIKAYNLEQKVMDQFTATSRSFIGHYMRVIRSQEIPGPLIEVMSAVGVAGVFFYITAPGQNGMAPKDFFGFITSIFLMYQPIKALVRLHSQLEQARAASLRVFEILAVQTTVADPAQPVPLQAAGSVIHFDGIDFSYEGKPVLQNIQLKVSPGQTVALVGSSGSGKTTLTNLLLRFYDPVKGTVRIGETDIRRVSLRELRAQIAVVTQETILFNDTIRNNIASGRPGAAEAEIVTAARQAHAEEFILAKSEGYESVVGEKGMTLSGGQRQRIAIARAILKNAPILVLDEATSALDTESERVVQAALEQLMVGRTTICIAHRLSTIQNADLIVVLSEGRMVETGTHAQLLKHGGHYQKLYELQFQH